jgi:hypothetical protein
MYQGGRDGQFIMSAQTRNPRADGSHVPHPKRTHGQSQSLWPYGHTLPRAVIACDLPSSSIPLLLARAGVPLSATVKLVPSRTPPTAEHPLAVFPSAVLAAAALAAEKVSFVLVGSAALWLRREITTVGDADAVIERGERNIHRLREALTDIAIGPVPPVRSFFGGSVVAVMTGYGKVDCLLERGRQGWGRLRRRAGFLSIGGVPVLVAASADAWELRRRYKGDEE